MTVSSGFFNSVNHDRLYDAEQLSSIFDGIIIDGVYENYGEALNVTAYPDANSTVIVGTGRAWFNHTWTLNDSQFSITIDPPNELLNRTDAIVIDVDKTQSVRKNSIIYVKGSESTPDLPPTFINTDLHKQYPICYISRPAGSNKPISQSDITITVGTSVCPIVTGVLDAQNLENLMQQLDDEFNDWWDGVKATLDENTVTNLQNQINELRDKIDSDDALVGLLEKPIAEAFMSGNYNLNIVNKTLQHSNTNNYSPVSTSSIKIPEATILPDGKIMCVRHYAEGETYSKTLYKLVVLIFDNEGIKHEYAYTIDRDTPVSAFSGNKSFTYYDSWVHRQKTIEFTGKEFFTEFFGNYKATMTLIPLVDDIYPVRFSMVYVSLGGIHEVSGEGGSTSNAQTQAQWYFDLKIDITVTSDGVVSFASPYVVNTTIVQVDDVYNNTNPPGGYVPDGRGSYMGTCSPINIYSFDDSYYFPRMAYYYQSALRRMLHATVMKLDDNGILSIGAIQRAQDNFWPETTSGTVDHLNQKTLICDTVSDQPAMITGDGVAFPIDVSNLQLQSGTTGATYIPKKVLHSAKAYSLSETNGVVTTSLVMGSAGQTTNSKKSNFFVGANNSNISIPNGGFIGQTIDDRLYGVETSSGHYVAIGTNGGCAILASTLSGISNVNLSNVQYYYIGYLETETQTVYLYINNLATYNQGNMGNVVRILRM